MPTGTAPTPNRRTSFRAATSKTASSFACAHETSADFPSGVILTRIGNPRQGSVAATLSVAVSMTERVSALRFVVQTCFPSGVTSIPSQPAPVGICATTLPSTRSIAVELPLPMFAVYSFLPSGISTSMCVTFWSAGNARLIFSAAASSSMTVRLRSHVA